MKDTTGAKDALGVRPLASYGERQRLLEEEEDEDGEVEMDMGGVENWVGKEGLTGQRVMNEARKVGYGWATGGELKIKEGRQRWERVLVGCLVEVSRTTCGASRVRNTTGGLNFPILLSPYSPLRRELQLVQSLISSTSSLTSSSPTKKSRTRILPGQ